MLPHSDWKLCVCSSCDALYDVSARLKGIAKSYRCDCNRIGDSVKELTNESHSKTKDVALADCAICNHPNLFGESDALSTPSGVLSQPGSRIYSRPKRDHAFIYLLRNKSNGMRYVGRTENSLEERWNGHVSASKHHPRLYKRSSSFPLKWGT